MDWMDERESVQMAKDLVFCIGVFNAFEMAYNSAVCILQILGSLYDAIIVFVEVTALPTPCSSLEASVNRVLSNLVVFINSLNSCLKSDLGVSVLM